MHPLKRDSNLLWRDQRADSGAHGQGYSEDGKPSQHPTQILAWSAHALYSIKGMLPVEFSINTPLSENNPSRTASRPTVTVFDQMVELIEELTTLQYGPPAPYFRIPLQMCYLNPVRLVSRYQVPSQKVSWRARSS